MNISVIIPTYNRLRTLLQALGSLQQQTLAEFEILVVDNGAREDTHQAIERFNERAKVPARYIPEPRLGLHNARHAGARTASGEILVFTDDDATFESGWLKAYADAFDSHPEMAAAGGRILPFWEEPPPHWLREMVDASLTNLTHFGELSLLDRGGEFVLDYHLYPFGVNMAIRRAILFEVGGFNPEAFGDLWLGDGETGLARKLQERQMLMGYLPQAVVHHHIPPQRMTVAYLCGRMANQGACDAYERFHRGIPSRFSLCLHALLIALRNGGSWLAARACRGRTSSRCVRFQMNAARTKSYVTYVTRLMWDNTLRQLVLRKNWLAEPELKEPARSEMLG
jgi:GT2 family glycosyltransferase